MPGFRGSKNEQEKAQGSLHPARFTPTGRADRKKPEKSGLFRLAYLVYTGRNIGVVNTVNSGKRSCNGKKARVSAKFSGVAGDLLFKHEHDFKNYHERGKNDVLVYQTETETE